MSVVNVLAQAFTGGMLPALQAITPVFEIISDLARAYAAVYAAVLIPIINVVAGALQYLWPVIELVATVVKGVAVVFVALSAVVQARVASIGEFVGALLPAFDLDDTMDLVKDAFHQARPRASSSLPSPLPNWSARRASI